MDFETIHINTLRKITGLHRMDCKSALIINNWDIEKSVIYLNNKKRRYL